MTKRRLEIPGEEEFEGFGVVYCSTCDGPLYKDKTIAVVGAGNSAFEAALEMNGIARKVYLVTRGELSADQVLRDKVATAQARGAPAGADRRRDPRRRGGRRL